MQLSRQNVILLTYNADEREMYGDALDHAGFRVFRVSDPSEALRLANEEAPAVLITRILQPGYAMDGIELTRKVKSSPTTASIPVVITTSLLPSEHREPAYAAGCDEYLLLPVLPDELVSVVSRLAKRPR
jgi:CheY-like chemotaxis protein